jgi:hypothetical protein
MQLPANRYNEQGRLKDINDAWEVIDLTKETEEVEEWSQAKIKRRFYPDLYNSSEKGPHPDKKQKLGFTAPKDEQWKVTKQFQYSKMKQVMNNLACHWKVNFKVKNIKKELFAQRGAFLSGFTSVPMSTMLTKTEMNNYAASFLNEYFICLQRHG